MGFFKKTSSSIWIAFGIPALILWVYLKFFNPDLLTDFFSNLININIFIFLVVFVALLTGLIFTSIAVIQHFRKLGKAGKTVAFLSGVRLAIILPLALLAFIGLILLLLVQLL